MATLNSRLKLHYELVDILGSNNVYYQPPESIKIQYPAIIYSRENIKNNFANNKVYIQNNNYKITVIDKNPDSEIVDAVSKMDSSKFVKHYSANNLNYDVFSIHYDK